MYILHADFGDDFRDLEVMQVCTVTEWFDNNITYNFSIAFLPNIWKQTQNIVFFAPNFVQRVVLTVARAICGASLQNFGSIQVCFSVKRMYDSILRSCNIKPCPNFYKHTEIRPLVGNTHMQIHCKWCSGWCLGAKICGRAGMHTYNIMIQQNLSDHKQKITTPLCLPMQNLTTNVNVRPQVFV